ncbi:hypothetical protein V2I01_38520 [Micromonospora sp. BRA006-A]|nr:hypothetical protein [Micromonospora sp. BRA006-A]
MHRRRDVRAIGLRGVRGQLRSGALHADRRQRGQPRPGAVGSVVHGRRGPQRDPRLLRLPRPSSEEKKRHLATWEREHGGPFPGRHLLRLPG